MIEISCGIPPGPDCVANARLAEELGYRRVWLYDSPPLFPQVGGPPARRAAPPGRIAR